MKYETVKSIVLAVLVVVSLVLTWNIWTYQPKYEPNDNEYVHEVLISEQEDSASLIKPSRILFHMNGAHFGTVSEEKIGAVLQEISSWNFYDIGKPKVQSNKQIEALSQGDNRVEINFPDLVPLELYKGIIHLDMKETPLISFNKIVILLTGDAKESGSVYFIATDEGNVYESHINKERLGEFTSFINRNRLSYSPYAGHQLPNGRIKFLPSDEISLKEYRYFSDYIDPEKFKRALFKDPTIVSRDNIPEGEQYTDSFSMLTVDYMTNMLFYVNPSQEPDQLPPAKTGELLKKSINFVNEHAGWTDNYRYFNMDPNKRSTEFRLHFQGYPVFNDQGMSEIVQYWGKEEIYQYRRPYFSLDKDFMSTDVKLPPGGDVLDRLLKEEEFNPELLQDLAVGFKLAKDDDNPKVLTLEPAWYYLYAGSWLRLMPEEKGRDDSGLEQD